MIFDWIDWSKKYEFMVILTKKNKKPIAILSEAYDRNLEVNVDTFNKFSFTVPKYIADRFSHEQIDNLNYDKVIEENMVLVKAFEEGKPNDVKFQSYFIIKNTEETTDESAKKVQCSSREVMLNKNIITLDGVERQLKKTEVSISDGIFDIIEQNSTWKLNYIDESCMYDNVNGGQVPKFRWFDALSKPIYQFLMEDVQNAYGVVLVFNSVDKTIDCYDKSTWGNHTGIILSEENYIKSLSRKSSTDNIVTKLEVSGRNGLGISDVNIWGGDYIYNYDYFKEADLMSSELIEALDKYESLLETKNTQFQSLRTQVVDVLSQIDIKNGEMTQLNEELKALRLIQAGYMSSNDNTNLPQATTNVNNKVIAIANKQAEITSLTTQKDNLNTQINQIALDIRTDNAKDSNGNLIFDEDLLEELEDFTYTESWSNDYYANSDALLKGGQDILKGWSVPTIDFEVDMADVFGTPETYRMWDKLNFKNGDFVRFYSKRFKINVDERIVGYQYSIDKNDLKISFSNKDKKSDDARSIGRDIKKGAEAGKIVNTKKLEWNSIKDTKNSVETFLNNSLDVAKQNIVSMQGRNRIDLDENGEVISDVNNPNNQLILIAGQMVVTSDGLQTVDTAIDSEGVHANMLIGRILAGKNLTISNEANNITIDESGFTLRDDTNKTLITPKGVANSDNLWMIDNIDSGHNLIMRFKIDENATIDNVTLNLAGFKYRAFFKSGQAGGSHRHRVFAKTGEQIQDPNNNLMNQYKFANSSDGGFTLNAYIPVLPSVEGAYPLADIYTFDSSGNHEHPPIYGIVEIDSMPDYGTLFIDGADRGSVYINTNQNSIDVSQFITTAGWHQIEISCNDKARVALGVNIKTYIKL